jgi:hypothetical protein
MSDLTAIALILLVPSAAHFTYVYQIKVLNGLAQVTATGVANGTAIPLSARWFTLRFEYLAVSVGLCIWTAMFVVLDLGLAGTTTDKYLRFFGYIHGLISFCGVIGAAGYTTLRARNLASILRQAEAD